MIWIANSDGWQILNWQPQDRLEQFWDCQLLFPPRCVFLHVALPGQQPGAEDFPADFVFPTMGQIGLNLVTVLDHFRVKMWVSVCVCFVFVCLCICGCLCLPQHSLDWSQFGHCPGSLQSINVRMYSCVCVFFCLSLSLFFRFWRNFATFCLSPQESVTMNKWSKRGAHKCLVTQLFNTTCSKVDN